MHQIVRDNLVYRKQTWFGLKAPACIVKDKLQNDFI